MYFYCTTFLLPPSLYFISISRVRLIAAAARLPARRRVSRGRAASCGNMICCSSGRVHFFGTLCKLSTTPSTWTTCYNQISRPFLSHTLSLSISLALTHFSPAFCMVYLGHERNHGTAASRALSPRRLFLGHQPDSGGGPLEWRRGPQNGRLTCSCDDSTYLFNDLRVYYEQPVQFS